MNSKSLHIMLLQPTKIQPINFGNISIFPWYRWTNNLSPLSTPEYPAPVSHGIHRPYYIHRPSPRTVQRYRSTCDSHATLRCRNLYWHWHFPRKLTFHHNASMLGGCLTLLQIIYKVLASCNWHQQCRNTVLRSQELLGGLSIDGWLGRNDIRPI